MSRGGNIRLREIMMLRREEARISRETDLQDRICVALQIDTTKLKALIDSKRIDLKKWQRPPPSRSWPNE